MARRLILLAIIAFGATAAGFRSQASALFAGPKEASVAARVLPAKLVEAEEVDSFIRRRLYTGVVKAARESEIGFERTGRLLRVHAEEGELVQQDQVLAHLDTRNLEARKRELQAQRASAQAMLDELIAGPRQETINAAAAAVRDLESQVELAELRFRRSESLLAKRAISKDEFDERSIGLRSIKAKLESAEEELEELQKGTRIEQLAAQRAAVAQLDAALENIAVDLEDSVLRAPFSGRVARRYLDEGVIVDPSAPILKLIETDRLEAWIGAPTETARRLELGQAMQVLVEGVAVDANVQAVLPEVDPATRTQTIIFALEDQTNVVPAQVARVEIGEEVAARGIWTPTTSLTRGSRGLWSVLVAEAHGQKLTAARRDVELLYTDGARALVTGTLVAGDRVLVAGAHQFVEGQTIQAISPQ